MLSPRITRRGAKRVPQAQVVESPPAAISPPVTPEHHQNGSTEYTLDVLKSPALKKYKRRRSNLGLAARVRTPVKSAEEETVDENQDPQMPPDAAVVPLMMPPREAMKSRPSSTLISTTGITSKRGERDTYSRVSSIFSDRDSQGKRKYSSTSSDGSDSARVSASEEELKHRPWKIDDFVLGKPLGRGKYGNVYHGKERITKFHMAVKILFKDRFVQDEALYILKREVAIQYRLRHNNIVSLYGCFEDKKNLYLLLEFCGNGELFKQLRKHRFLPEQDACQYIAQIADALKYMHARNVIHRDIKPENMLISEDGTLKIADFGWAVHAPAPQNIRRTLCGTPEYLSPEMLSRSGHTWSVDIWGLGIMTYELLCGHTPFIQASRSPIEREPGQEEEKSDKLQQIYDRIMNYQDDICLPSHVPSVSDQAQEFIRSCIVNNPAMRPSAAELLAGPWLNQT